MEALLALLAIPLVGAAVLGAIGHREHAPDAGLADRRRRAERVAVEGVELQRLAEVAHRAHELRQVVAPVAGQHRVRTAGADLGRIRQEVLHAAERVQLVADDLDVGAHRSNHRARLARDVLAEAVVLVDQVQPPHLAVGAQHLDERGQPHVGVRVEAEVPGAAALVGQARVDGRIVQQERAPFGVALVVLVDRVDQRRGDRRAVALQHEADALVDGAAQQRECFLGLALAVEAHEPERPPPAGQRDAAASVDALDGPLQVAEHGLAGVGERARQALDQRQPQRRTGRLRNGRRQQRIRGEHEQRATRDRLTHLKVLGLKTRAGTRTLNTARPMEQVR